MKPAGSTPVMTDTERNITLIDSKAICEDFEETIEKFPLISGGASGRAEIRRLVAWFDENFYGDVVAPMLHERMRKRLNDRAAPDARILREAMKRATTHLAYLDYLLDHRTWMGGATIILAAVPPPAPLSIA